MLVRVHVGYTGVDRVEEEEEEACVRLAPDGRVVRPIIAVDLGPRMTANGEVDRLLGVGEGDFFVGKGDVDRVVGEGVRLCLASGLPRSWETHSMYLETH